MRDRDDHRLTGIPCHAGLPRNHRAEMGPDHVGFLSEKQKLPFPVQSDARVHLRHAGHPQHENPDRHSPRTPSQSKRPRLAIANRRQFRPSAPGHKLREGDTRRSSVSVACGHPTEKSISKSAPSAPKISPFADECMKSVDAGNLSRNTERPSGRKNAARQPPGCGLYQLRRRRTSRDSQRQ